MIVAPPLFTRAPPPEAVVVVIAEKLEPVVTVGSPAAVVKLSCEP